MEQERALGRVLIACCGNPLAGDDSLGGLVARALVAAGLPNAVEVVDLGANPAALTDHLEGCAALVVVDAIASEDHRSGALIDCDWRDAREAARLSGGCTASTHGLGIADQLALAEKLGLLPRVVRLIGLTVGQARIGSAPSALVRAGIDGLAARVRTVVNGMLAGR